MSSKASRIPGAQDRLRKHFINLKDLEALIRNRDTPRSVQATRFSGGSAAGATGGGTGNFLPTAGGTMTGNIAYEPKLIAVNDGRVDLDPEGNPPENSSYILVTGQGSPDDIRFIDGAERNGQYLIYQGTNSQLQYIKNANLLFLTNIVGNGIDNTITVTLSDTGTLQDGDTVNIIGTTNFDANDVTISNLIVDTSFEYDLGSIGSTTAETSGTIQDGNIITPDGNNVLLDGTLSDFNVPVVELIFDITVAGFGAWRVIGNPQFPSAASLLLSTDQGNDGVIVFNDNDISGGGIVDEGNGIFRLRGSVYTIESHARIDTVTASGGELLYQWERADDLAFTTNVISIGTVGHAFSVNEQNQTTSSQPFLIAEVDASEQDFFVRLNSTGSTNFDTILSSGTSSTIVGVRGGVGGGGTGGGGTSFPIRYPKVTLQPGVGVTQDIDLNLNTGNAKVIDFPAGDIGIEFIGDPTNLVAQDVYLMFVQPAAGGSNLIEAQTDSRIKNRDLMISEMDTSGDAKTVFRLVSLDGGVSYHAILVDLSTAAGGTLTALAIDADKDWANRYIQNIQYLQSAPDTASELPTQGFIRTQNDEIIFGARTDLDDGNIELKVNESDFFDITNSAEDPVVLSLRAQDGSFGDLSSSWTQLPNVANLGGLTTFAFPTTFDIDHGANTVLEIIEESANDVVKIFKGGTNPTAVFNEPVDSFFALSLEDEILFNFQKLLFKEFDQGGLDVGAEISQDTNGLRYLIEDTALKHTFSFGNGNLIPFEDVLFISNTEIDVNTLDIINIDRALFVNDAGSVTASDISQILLNDNSQFQFNTDEDNTITLTLGDVPAVIVAKNTAVNNEVDVTIQSDSSNVDSFAFLNISRAFDNPAADSGIGSLVFQGGTTTTVNTVVEYAAVVATIEDPVTASLDGSLHLEATLATNVTRYLSINDGANDQVDIFKDLDMNGNDILMGTGGNITAGGATEGMSNIGQLTFIDNTATPGSIAIFSDGTDLFANTGSRTLNLDLATETSADETITGNWTFDENITAGGSGDGVTNIGHLDFIDNLATPGAALSIYSDGTDLFANTGGGVVNFSNIIPQSPWLSNIDAAGFSLDNLLSLGIDDSAGDVKLSISGPLGVGARFTFVSGDSVFFTENITDRLQINASGISLLGNNIAMGTGGNVSAGGATVGMSDIGQLTFVNNTQTPGATFAIFSDGTDLFANTGSKTVNLDALPLLDANETVTGQWTFSDNIIAGGATLGMTTIGHLDFLNNTATPAAALSIYSDGTDLFANTGGGVVNFSDIGGGGITNPLVVDGTLSTLPQLILNRTDSTMDNQDVGKVSFQAFDDSSTPHIWAEIRGTISDNNDTDAEGELEFYVSTDTDDDLELFMRMEGDSAGGNFTIELFQPLVIGAGITSGFDLLSAGLNTINATGLGGSIVFNANDMGTVEFQIDGTPKIFVSDTTISLTNPINVNVNTISRIGTLDFEDDHTLSSNPGGLTINLDSADTFTLQDSGVTFGTFTDDEARLIAVDTGTLGYRLRLGLDSTSPADNDALAIIPFLGNDSEGNQTTFAQITAHSTDVTNGTEDGDLQLEVIRQNIRAIGFKLSASGGNTVIHFFGNPSGATQQTINGSRGGNVALADLLTKLADYGLIIDNTT